MKVVITGGAGFLGKKLARRILRAGGLNPDSDIAVNRLDLTQTETAGLAEAALR